MLSESFAHHIKEIRKPLSEVKTYALEKINILKPHCRIMIKDELKDKEFLTNFEWNKRIDKNLDASIIDLVE